MNKVIYISGPMSNMPELNFPAFHAAATELRAQGHTVVNPAEIGQDDGLEWHHYMRKDIRALMDCNEIYLLRGWASSRGARLEHHIARELGMNITGARL